MSLDILGGFWGCLCQPVKQAVLHPTTVGGANMQESGILVSTYGSECCYCAARPPVFKDQGYVIVDNDKL